MEQEALVYCDRRHTDSTKWDGMEGTFSRGDLDPFWVADMDFQAPRCVREAVEDWARKGIYGYYRAPEDYQNAFLDWEAGRHGLHLERDWLRFSPGIVTALFWLVQTLTAPGDPVAVMKPVYYPFFRAIEDTGRTLVSCRLVNTGGVYTVDFDALAALLDTTGAKVLILSNPHNPVGRVYRRNELEQICALCAARDVTILSDEIHQDLVFPGHTHVPTQSIGVGRVVTLASASKTFNLAGLQNSFVVIPDQDLRERYDAFVKGTSRMNGGVSVGYVAAAAAFRGGAGWLDSLLGQIRANFEGMRDILAREAPKAVVTELEGTYLMWVDLGAYVQGQEAVRTLMEDTCGLAVDYGSWFGGEEWAGFVRFNLATSHTRCLEAAHRLCRGLAALG